LVGNGFLRLLVNSFLNSSTTLLTRGFFSTEAGNPGPSGKFTGKLRPITTRPNGSNSHLKETLMPPPARQNVQPTVEVLEDRCLPSHATLSSGVLNIQRTTGIDTIIVRQINNVLSIDGVKIQTGNTSVASVPVSAVVKIQVHGGDGNDVIHLNSQNN